jgi:hypothetical protein
VKPSTPAPDKLNSYAGVVRDIKAIGYQRADRPNLVDRPAGTITFWGNPPTHVTVDVGHGEFIDVNYRDKNTGWVGSKSRPYPVVQQNGVTRYPYYESYVAPPGSIWVWDGKWENVPRYVGGDPTNPKWLCWGFAANVVHDCTRLPKTK